LNYFDLSLTFLIKVDYSYFLTYYLRFDNTIVLFVILENRVLPPVVLLWLLKALAVIIVILTETNDTIITTTLLTLLIIIFLRILHFLFLLSLLRHFDNSNIAFHIQGYLIILITINNIIYHLLSSKKLTTDNTLRRIPTFLRQITLKWSLSSLYQPREEIPWN